MAVREVLLFGFLCFCAVGASAGLITGLVIGGIVILLCVLGAVFCAVKHKGKIKQQQAMKTYWENGSKNINLSWHGENQVIHRIYVRFREYTVYSVFNLRLTDLTW